jgi:hypothetical protein
MTGLLYNDFCESIRMIAIMLSFLYTVRGQQPLLYPGADKVEEKRENLSLRILRKAGEREREIYFAPYFEISHTKIEKLFSEKSEKSLRKRK